jgi:hypothetical protein
MHADVVVGAAAAHSINDVGPRCSEEHGWG